MRCSFGALEDTVILITGFIQVTAEAPSGIDANVTEFAQQRHDNAVKVFHWSWVTTFKSLMECFDDSPGDES